MTRWRRIALIAGASLLGLILVLFVAGIVIVQTDWFRNMVRTKLIATVEESTGGKVDIASFNFDWHHLRATVRNFVLHGLEPADAPPLFRANLLQVDLKLLSPLKGMVDINYLGVDTPQANVIVFPDGRTNVPAPKIKKPSDKTGLETVVDLAIRRFNLDHGSFTFAERKTDFNAAGENLRAQLAYNMLNPSYTGEIDIAPLHVRNGNNAPLDISVKLPLTLEKDKITLKDAHLNSPQSEVVVSGSMEHLLDPRTSAHLNARVALEEVRRVAGLVMQLDTTHGPQFANADITATMDSQYVRLQSARVTLGSSDIEASGTLKDPKNPAAVQFSATLNLTQLGRLFEVAARPEGTVKAGGNATLNANNDYLVTANVDARNLAFRQGTTRITGVSLDSSVTADPHRIELAGLRLSALGGGFTGSGEIREMQAFRVAGNLHNFDIETVVHALGMKPLGYDGVVSGPVQAQGDLKHPADATARANLAIAPGRRGIPVSGRLNADYNGRADTVTLGRSYLTLPNTRIDLSGSLGKQIDVRVVSRNLNDFKPVAPSLPVTLQNGGAATINATVTGKLSEPKITGQVAVTNFAVDGRPFTRLTAELNASSAGVSIGNGTLSRGPLQAQFTGMVGLRNWKPDSNAPLRLDVTMRNADLADVLALAGQSNIPATGALTADIHIAGTMGSPVGNADLTVVSGTLQGEPFDRLAARVAMTPQAINVPTLELVAGPSRLDANATYQHPLNDLKRGAIQAHVASNQVQLAQFQSLVKDRPGLRGTLTLNADAAATVAPAPNGTDVQLTAVNGNFGVRGLEMQGKNLGDLTATATTAAGAVRYNVNSNIAGSTIRVNGQTLLAADHRTAANAVIANLPIEQTLALAGRSDLPVTGTLSATAQVSGTLQDPHATANFNIAKGSAYQEPFDRLQATIGYSNQLIDVPNLELVDGGSTLTLSASFAHPAGDFEDGQVRFKVQSNDIQLARLHKVQEAQPGLDGIVRLAADGAATLRKNQPPLFASLTANIAAHNLAVNKKPLGELTATAETRGQEVNFNLTSDFAKANIRGSGRLGLTGDYPLTAQVSFSNLTYSGLSALLTGPPQPLEASTEGQINVSGPLDRTDDLRGTVQLTKLEAHSTANGPIGEQPRVNFEIHNEGPIVASLDRSVVTIQSARLTGPMTNLSLSGTAALKAPGTLNLRADGNIKLETLEAFSPDIFSSGSVVLNAAVSGTTDKPVVNGRLQLQNASFNYLDLPNGLTNANGTVTFNGTEAVIQNITGESGGGKITVAGFVGYGGPEMQIRVQATVDGVRVEYPETVSTQINARLTLAGTTSRSLLSGNVTILDVALHSHSDIGSMLTSAATPAPTPTTSTGFMAGLRFDIRIQTAPDVQFRTTLTQNLQAEANLTLRGTPDHPGMLGRVVVTQGEVVFFGHKYTIDQGTIAFYNPQKIDPILNVNLETKAQGIDVSIGVTGHMDRLKLAYRSDPPMAFSDIVSLLASGKVSTTDPVLAARQPQPLDQNFEQKGASALLGQAVANPVSGRLQRLFGVSALKIDPQITGTSNTPQATLTLQQQISRDITFTYIQNISESNPQIVRVEWAIDPQWSAIAQRDLNGMFDLDFFWKKRFW